jgi:hypothetical protein
LEAIASWQLASSRCTSLLESKVVTVALLALAVSLALLMMTCSTGLAWIATKCAMLTCLLALPEPPEVPCSSPELSPQAASPATPAATNQPDHDAPHGTLLLLCASRTHVRKSDGHATLRELGRQ